MPRISFIQRCKKSKPLGRAIQEGRSETNSKSEIQMFETSCATQEIAESKEVRSRSRTKDEDESCALGQILNGVGPG